MSSTLKQTMFGGFKKYFTANADWVDPFDSIKWKIVDAEIRKADGSVAFSQKGVEVPEWWNQTTINIVADKYFRVINGVRETSAKQMFGRVTRTLANWAWEQNYFNSEEEREVYEKELRYALIHQYGAFNSPVWFNLGVPGRRQAASACFISSVEDSLDSIMEFQKSEAVIFAGGSGSGANFSKIRSSYEKLSSGSYTSGPLSWMRGLDQYAMAMKSGGSTRNAAKMAILDMDHPDILETKDGRAGFITCKAEQEKLAHQLVEIGYSTAYDDPNGAYKRVMYQNANHSVSIPDSFMQAVVDDQEWSTKSRLDGSVVKTYRARDLWREIAQAAWVCGDPGVQFTDTINSWHTTTVSGPIRGSNPCFHPDTRISTAFGLIRIEDLYNEVVDGTVVITTALDGAVKTHEATVFPTGVKPVIEVHTSRGRVLRVTADHRLMTESGWVEAGQLESGIKLLIQPGEGQFGTYVPQSVYPVDIDAYKMAGWIVGDGYILKDNPNIPNVETGLVFGKDDKDCLGWAEAVLNRWGVNYGLKRQTASVGESPDYMRIRKRDFRELMIELACSPGVHAGEKRVKEAIFRASKEHQLAFIAGLISSDGTVNVRVGKDINLRIGSTSLGLLRDVQSILLNMGVNSTIYQDRKAGQKPSAFTYTTASGELRTYSSNLKLHDIIVNGESLRRLRDMLLDVGMPSARKAELLRSIPDAVANNGRDKWYDKVAQIVDNGEQTIVYDITEPVTHSLIAEGVVAHNCSEYLNVDNTACNLAAINLSRLFKDRKFSQDDFIQVVRLLSTAQMAIIALADYPTEAITENSKKMRPIGINYGDLGTIIMDLGYSYDSDEGRAVAARLASLMTGLAYLNSSYIASRVGAFSEFERNRDCMMAVMTRHQMADVAINDVWGIKECPIGMAELSREVWTQVVDSGTKYGYNIGQASLQAPLGTISFLMGMNTTGIEPAFSLISYKSMVGGGYMKLVNSAVPGALKNLGYSETEVKDISDFVSANDCIEGAPHIKSEHLAVFDCAMPSGPSGRHLSPESHIKMMAAIQPLITCAMSKTVNLPNSATVEDIEEIYLKSWKLGLKCVALYRDGCKASQPLAVKKEEKIDKEEKKPVINWVQETLTDESPETLEAIRNRLPDDINGRRHRFEINGFKGYIVVNEYEDGRPGEVFLKLGKPGSTISGLIDGFTQLLSVALQYGVPLPKLIHSFIDTSFEPAGMTNNKKIRFTKSIYDYLFKYLDINYHGGEHSGLAERIAMIDEAEAKKKLSAPKAMKSIKTSKEDVKPKKSLSSPPCTRCGNMTQKNGTCYVCTSCGTTTGCS